MSRSALAVAGVLFALGVIAWLLATDSTAPVAPATAIAPQVPAAPATVGAEPAPLPVAGAAPTPAPAPLVNVSNRDELIRALNARGLDGETLLAGYQEWRVAHGFLDADVLAGVSAEDAPAQVYATMTRDTQKSLADSGELGAIQAYAAGSLPGDPFTAVEYYGRASKLGSAAAMGEISAILAAIGGFDPGSAPNDRTAADKLLALRGGDAGRDLGKDAAAWTLASIRQYGPMLASPRDLAQLEELGRNPDKNAITITCGRSLAILADLSAAASGRSSASLPPVFVAGKNLYERLPCQDTPAPVMPPRALAACSASPARNGAGQPVDLWICPEK